MITTLELHFGTNGHKQHPCPLCHNTDFDSIQEDSDCEINKSYIAHENNNLPTDLLMAEQINIVSFTTWNNNSPAVV